MSMCNQSTVCNLYWNIGTDTGTAPRRGASGWLYPILYRIHNTVTDRRCAMLHSNTPPVKRIHLVVLRPLDQNFTKFELAMEPCRGHCSEH